MDKVGGDIEINDSAGKDKAAGDAATSNEAAADKAVQDAVLGDAASGDKAGPSSVPTIDKAATSSVATSDAAIEDKAGPSMEKAAIGEAKGETAVSDTAASDQELRLELLREREKLVLWRQPVRTLYYFFIESFLLLLECGKKLLNNRKLLAVILCMITLLTASLTIAGPHQKFVMAFKKRFLWCSYWVGLGVLSSVGLGTGLHTFVLYLGPHIAAVTLAAFECMSVNFPEPPYPDDIICPETPAGATMSLWTIMSKVRLEAFMWGAGTAIGELPPYFMARASRLSGTAEEEEDLGDQTSPGPIERVKLIVQELVHRVGFLGIFICASIPNPLFDLAGITCGHFLVPFRTFFGATLIGKAVVKMHVQKLFVIFVFSERHVEGVVKLIGSLPHLGPSLQSPFKEYLTSQKHKLHRGRVRRVEGGKHGEGGESWLSWLFEKVVIVMVVYFIMSIINSLAQNYHKRLSEEKLKKTS